MPFFVTICLVPPTLRIRNLPLVGSWFKHTTEHHTGKTCRVFLWWRGVGLFEQVDMGTNVTFCKTNRVSCMCAKFHV